MKVNTKYVPKFVLNLFGANSGLKSAVSQEMAKDKKKRPSYAIKRQRQYLAALGQDELKIARALAEDPDNPNREQLYAIYKEVYRDLHLKSQIRTAIAEVISEPFVIRDKKTKKVHEQLTELLKNQWFEDIGQYVLEAEFWGYSVIEFQVMFDNPDPVTKPFAPLIFKAVVLFPREHVRPETGEILINPWDTEGLPMREEPFNTWLLEAGNPNDLGLLEALAVEAIYKKFTKSDWSRSGEKWGDPIVILKNSSDNEAETSKKEEFLANLGNNGYAIVDDDDEFELIERQNDSGYKIFSDFIAINNEEMSKGINGQTGTTEQKAFVGAAEVHERILDTYTESRLRGLMYYHNSNTLPFLIGKGYKLEGMEWVPTRFIPENKPDTKPTDNPDDENDPNKKPDAPDPKNPDGKKKDQGGDQKGKKD